MAMTEKTSSLFVFQSLGYDFGRSASRLPWLLRFSPPQKPTFPNSN